MVIKPIIYAGIRINQILVSWFYKLIFYRQDEPKHCLALPHDTLLLAEIKYIL
jgi:hypothetical protein